MVAMIIVDGSWTFDTDLMIQYAEKDERTSYERDIFNQFRKYSYWRLLPNKRLCEPKKVQTT
ncbi:hypothetical protein ACT7DJ_10370 [Bacillus cereus]